MHAAERMFLSRLRCKTMVFAHGRVIEIGAGTGRNIPFFSAASVERLEVVEPDPHMRRRAAERASAASFPIDLVDATAEDLPFADNYADVVVATLVFCSVDDPARAVQEVRRVLRPGGKLVFIEHIRSDEPWRSRLQDFVTPVWRRITANCHVNRATLALFLNAGFEIHELERLAVGLPWTHPVVAGFATAAQ